MTVPRWGVHQGIKFSPRRSVLKVCPICKEFFLQSSRGNKSYCDELCSVKARQFKMKLINQKIIRNRDKSEHADYMMRYRENNVSNKVISKGTYIPPSVPVDNNGNPDYVKYHELLSVDKRRFGLSSPH
ncbi:hypothetical protein [Methanobacterium sp.]|uniref:hypothetical protein n=1 Tax=Methanobacterium sp. TaxID=2164 RepID=UPI00315944C8